MQRDSAGEKTTRFLVIGHIGNQRHPKYMAGFLRRHLLNSRAGHDILEAKPRASKRQSEISIAQHLGDKISQGRGFPKTQKALWLPGTEDESGN